jgi:hypothetical protein
VGAEVADALNAAVMKNTANRQETELGQLGYYQKV